MSKKTLGIDTGLTWGFALSTGKLGERQITAKARGKRLCQFRGQLEDVLFGFDVQVIVAEDAYHAAANREQARTHCQFGAILEILAHERGAEVRWFSPSTVKKWATGHGRADKVGMIAAASAQLDVQTRSEHVADAVWLLHMGRCDVRDTKDTRDHPQNYAGRMKSNPPPPKGCSWADAQCDDAGGFRVCINCRAYHNGDACVACGSRGYERQEIPF